MTRLPGFDLSNSRDLFEPVREGPWVEELRMCVDSMRQWTPPDERRIRPHHGPHSQTQKPFYEHLFGPTSSHALESKEKFDENVEIASRLRQRSHRIVFSHGDFRAHNIMVDDDEHLSGFLDWETAGWYPEYWEYTTTMRWGGGSWWYQYASWIGGYKYLEELVEDKALNSLTVHSYIAF
ncbi:hypothetical protein BJX70DRAFT_409707 [Aspergillus crustosus]